MGVNDWSQAEKDLYAIGTRAILDGMERARESMTADLDLYRDDWSTRHAEMTRAHEDRVRQMRDDHHAWLRSLYDDEGPQPQDVAQGQGGASAGSSPAPASPPAGPGPGQPLTDADIKAMDMAAYTALRARIGVANASARGLFG